MRLIRGRAGDPDADRAATDAMLRRVGETGEPALRAWTPHRQLAFGRRDSRAAGYQRARRAAEARGFPPIERSVGGRAVAYTGTTVAFAHAVPLDDPRRGLDERYRAAVDGVLVALHEVGVEVARGEPADAFCPGEHSVQARLSARPTEPARMGKVAGIAQRVTSGAALVAGCVLVDGREELADVLDAVYGALGQPFDPASVGTVAAADGPAESAPVTRALERAFGGDDAAVEPVDELLD